MTRNVRLDDLYMIIQQFATLTDAMIPIPQILELICARNMNRSLHTLLERARCEVEDGMPLSAAFETSRLKLPDFVTVMIRIGESTGQLKEIFRELESYLSRLQRFRRMILQASVYPILLVGISVIAIGFMILIVLPSLVLSLSGNTSQLPALTRALLAVGVLVKGNAAVLLASVVFLISVPPVLVRTDRGSVLMNALLIRLPVIGKLIIKMNMIYLSRNLSLLLKNGIDMVYALSVVHSVMTNHLLRMELEKLIQASVSGIPVSQTVMESEIFPHFMREMVRIGDASSKLPEMLDKAAQQYQVEIEAFMGVLSHLLEPVLIIVIGLLIGGILIATYLPLFQMVSHFPV